MDPSHQDASAGRRQTVQTSPTDASNNARDSTAGQPGDGFGESYQSTETVRHRPEPGAGYGMCYSLHLDLCWDGTVSPIFSHFLFYSLRQVVECC